MSLNILLTCVGGGLAPQLIRSLKSSKIYKNIKVFGVDMNPDAAGKDFADYFQTVSNGMSKNFIDQIIKISRKYNINIIIPGSAEDALNLSKNKSRIETNKTKNYNTFYKFIWS